MANNINKVWELMGINLETGTGTYKNRMGLGNAITRDNGIPLDLSSLHATYNDAVVYAATNAIAYVDQVIAAEGVVYIITTESQGKVTIGNYKDSITGKIVESEAKEYDVYLKPVGTIPGFDEAANGTLPQIQIDEEGKRTLTWVPIDAIVDGDGNTKTVVAAGSPNVHVTTTQNEETDTYTYTISVDEPEIPEIPEVPEYAIKKLDTPSEGSQATYKLTKAGKEVDVAIEIPEFPVITHPEYKIVKEEKAEGATETTYHLEKDGVEVTEEIIVPDAYDDTALTNRVSKIEEFFATAEGESLDQALDTLIEIQKYIDEDGEVAEQVLANKTAIETLNGNAETDGSVDKKISEAFATANLSQYAKAADVETLSGNLTTVDTKASNAQKAIDDYSQAHAADYTNTQIDTAISELAGEVQTALDGKQDEITLTTIEHTTGEATDSVSLVDGTLAIVVDAYKKSETYSKSEVDKAITDKIADMTGGESAADVLAALNDYKKAINNEIFGKETVDSYENTTSRIDTNSSNITTLLGDDTVAGSVAEAKKAGTDAAAAVDALSKGQVATNKKDIAALVTRVGNVESTVGGHTTEISTLAGKITTLEGADTTINTTLGEHAASITALGQKDAELAGLINGNTTAITNEATARANADDALAERIKVYEDNKDSYATKAEVKVNTDAIAALVGTDTNKTARAIAAEEVAKIVGTAPEAFDTLEEVATWIANDTSGAAAMANDIAVLKTAVNTTLPEAISTAKTEAIADALEEADKKYVTANANNELTYNGEVIILSGGNAKANTSAEA
ncbi:MAG: hypothetical protein J6A25_00830 [Lachnospiraceae bacterium]|nr:hypothetical protein [Lachnospiraceae bacterium]